MGPIARHAALASSLVLAMFVAAACGASPPRSTPPPARAADGRVSSNALRSDYAGSKVCGDCHSEIYRRWQGSPMHRMTRLAEDVPVEPVFDGVTFPFKGDRVTLERAGNVRFMRLETQRKGTSIYKVTKIIGGRYREDFVGVEVDRVGPDAHVIGDPSAEPVLPVSYLIFNKSLRYKGYSVMNPERPYIDKGAAWRQTCIFCHNTAPYLSTVFDDLLGGPTKSYQGSVSDKVLPADRLWSFSITDRDGLGKAVAEEIHFLDGEREPPGTRVEDLLADAIGVTRKRFGQEHFVEVGIGCEACHGGSKEHAEDVSRRPTFELRSSLFATRPPTKGPVQGSLASPPGKDATHAQWVNRTCSRCHTVLFSKYRYTWEGGDRNGDAGGSTINSGEGRDFQLGACSSQMSCVTCHDPHAEDAKDKLALIATIAGNATCLPCHQKLESESALRAHTHHSAASTGSVCVECHMPRKNTGLGYRLTRYHRIGSPNDPVRVERDRPLECALCHKDKSVGALVDAMETWWGKRYDRAAIAALYGGDLAGDAIERTAALGKPHEQIAAAAVLGERGERRALPLLVPLLEHAYPIARGYAKHAIEQITGSPLGIDLDRDPQRIRAEAAAWLERQPPLPPSPKAP